MCGEDYCDIDFDESDDWDTYDVVVEEVVRKIVHVYAKDAESAKKYLTEFVGLDKIDMEKDIDEYERNVTKVEESGVASHDYAVPSDLYEWWW